MHFLSNYSRKGLRLSMPHILRHFLFSFVFLFRRANVQGCDIADFRAPVLDKWVPSDANKITQISGHTLANCITLCCTTSTCVAFGYVASTDFCTTYHTLSALEDSIGVSFYEQAPNPIQTPTPTIRPTLIPTPQTTPQPTPTPTIRPTVIPTPQQTLQPTPQHTPQPTLLPSPYPTLRPTPQQTPQPTLLPSPYPTLRPTPQQTPQPTGQPTPQHTPQPTLQPTLQPTSQPTGQPTPQQTPQPTIQPTPQPTSQPTPQQTPQPTLQPTPQPTSQPTGQPTPRQTPQPTIQPTPQPTSQPTPQQTPQPTLQPTPQPTSQPTGQPTPQQTPQPTIQPTPQPTSQPTPQQTPQPTLQPTPQPTSQPTGQPTPQQTPQPTIQPTPQPTSQPTPQQTPHPTLQPTPQPTAQPTGQPTPQQTPLPTMSPIPQHTPLPTGQPTPQHTPQPTPQPTLQPTPQHTAEPTSRPSVCLQVIDSFEALDLSYTSYTVPVKTPARSNSIRIIAWNCYQSIVGGQRKIILSAEKMSSLPDGTADITMSGILYGNSDPNIEATWELVYEGVHGILEPAASLHCACQGVPDFEPGCRKCSEKSCSELTKHTNPSTRGSNQICGGLGDSSSECIDEPTFFDAMRYCSGEGMRLCTADELRISEATYTNCEISGNVTSSYYVGPFSKLYVSTYEDCCSACASDSMCVHMSYRSSSDECRLFRSVNNIIENIWWQRDQAFEMVASSLYDGDIIEQLEDIMSFEECCEHCIKSSACIHMSYRSSHHCRLFSSVTEIISNNFWVRDAGCAAGDMHSWSSTECANNQYEVVGVQNGSPTSECRHQTDTALGTKCCADVDPRDDECCTPGTGTGRILVDYITADVCHFVKIEVFSITNNDGYSFLIKQVPHITGLNGACKPVSDILAYYPQEFYGDADFNFIERFVITIFGQQSIDFMIRALLVGCCHSDFECADLEPCTIDACVNTRCQHTLDVSDASCSGVTPVEIPEPQYPACITPAPTPRPTPGGDCQRCSLMACNELKSPLGPGYGHLDVCGDTEFDNLCPESADHHNGIAWCRASGLRLCTVAELENDEVRGTGCELDDVLVWSADECVDNVTDSLGYFVQYGMKQDDYVPPVCAPLNGTHPPRCCGDFDNPFMDCCVECRQCSINSCQYLNLDPTMYGKNDMICATSKFPTCAYARTYVEASTICANHNMRLCSFKELTDDEARDSGCTIDQQLAWSATGCGPGQHWVAAGQTPVPPVECFSDTSLADVRCCADDLRDESCCRYEGCSECSAQTCFQLDIDTNNPDSLTDSVDVCSDDSRNGTSCSGALDFSAAATFCSSVDMRLCTIQEFENEEAIGLDCGYDNEYVWSSTSCGASSYYVSSPNQTALQTQCFPQIADAYGVCCADFSLSAEICCGF